MLSAAFCGHVFKTYLVNLEFTVLPSILAVLLKSNIDKRMLIASGCSLQASSLIGVSREA